MLVMQKGFSLIEMMIVIAIIAVLAAFAYPSYQNYVVKTKRADMMSEMQNIAKRIEALKLGAGRGGYANVNISEFVGDYPKQGKALYTVSITDSAGVRNRIGSERWIITATPVSGTTQANDGNLSLNYNGQKCRASTCGTGDEWRK